MAELYYDEYGAGRPLVLMHGLFGSGTNWRAIARSLGEHCRVLVPDARNHGRSPHLSGMSYPEMADDISAWLSMLGIQEAILVGHSMGGKTAMTLALTQPKRVRALGVIDIAPVTYSHTHAGLIEAMRALDLRTLRSRTDADRALAVDVPDAPVRGFLLQNLVLDDGVFSWRLNLDALAEHMDQLVGFPEFPGRTYDGSATFIYGTLSDYVRPGYHSEISRLFPRASIQPIEGAGHWLQVEQPTLLLQHLTGFIADV